MALQLYNSLGKKIEEFKPQKDGEVSLYVCGITPDAATHLGHAFTYLTFDVLIRYFKYKGLKVNYLQNVTDIDDDILVRSKKAGYDWKEFGDKWTKVFVENMAKLNWIAPDPYVKATDAIPTIIKIVSGLVGKGFAYEKDGTVYFETSKFGKYGELGKYGRDEMMKISAERGGDPADTNKRDPLDFIIWQAAKPGEPIWDSPWGKGRPGWHIECSSMIYENLGSQIDIHGGGADLIFPHHESEIAQSESYTGKSPFANFFMHVEYLKHGGEKMSKSLGNLVLVSDLLEKYDPNAVRLLLLSHHYREEWDFEEEEMEEAAKKWKALSSGLDQDQTDSGVASLPRMTEDEELDHEFIEAIEDDLNTPKALEILETKNLPNLKFHLELLGFKV